MKHKRAGRPILCNMLGLICLAVYGLGQSACITRLELQVPQKSEVNLPDSLHQWLLIDRSPIRAKGSRPPRLMRDEAIPDRFAQPSILILEDFIKYIENEAEGNQVVPVHLQLPRLAGSPPPLLESESIRYLCDEYHADALVALEGLDISFDTLMQEDDEVIGGGWWNAWLNVKVRCIWRVYSADGQAVLDRWTEQWQQSTTASGYSPTEAVQKLPQQKEIYAEWLPPRGREYARSLCPPRVTVERFLYTRKSGPNAQVAHDMQRAGELAMQGNWQEAALLWAPIARLPQLKHTAAKAACNMAVACEEAGDLRAAREWLLLAVETYHFAPARKYLAQLRQRFRSYKTVNN